MKFGGDLPFGQFEMMKSTVQNPVKMFSPTNLSLRDSPFRMMKNNGIDVNPVVAIMLA